MIQQFLYFYRSWTTNCSDYLGSIRLVCQRDQDFARLVMLLYSDISNFTFWSVKILKCKIFLFGFLDELGNFKQKKNYTSTTCFTFYSNRPLKIFDGLVILLVWNIFGIFFCMTIYLTPRKSTKIAPSPLTL